MRILKFNESNKFQKMKSIMDDLNNILVELKDEGISMIIEPSNDIRVKMASIQDGHFYIKFTQLSNPWPKIMNIYPLIFEKIHMLIEYLEEKGFYTEISYKNLYSTHYEKVITIEELEELEINLTERAYSPPYENRRLSYINLKFFRNKVNESLPNQKSVDQLERVMKISAKTDIGNRISDMNKQGANIHYIQNPIETGIESREDYENYNKKFIPSWNLKNIEPFKKNKSKKKK
jgi:hypothetical protein